MNKTVEQRRRFVKKAHGRLTVARQCRLLGLYRSTAYYKPRDVSDSDLALMLVMDKIHTLDPALGTRGMRRQLRLMGHNIGRDKVRSLMRKMRIKAVYCKPRTTVIDPTRYKYPYLLRDENISRPNQAWAIDITYVPMRKGFLYLCCIIDLYSRFIVGWDISNSMEAEWVVEVVKSAVRGHGKPDIINSDQGSQFTSDEYVQFIKSLKKTKISMDGKGRATDNAHVERFFRTIKYDKLYPNPSDNGQELYRKCEEFINYYNHIRGHSSVGEQPPVVYYRKAA